jgi:hypothetical protein
MMDQSWQDPHEHSEDDMARLVKKTSDEDTQRLIANYLARLKSAGRDREKFQHAVSALQQDTALSAADVISIALQYRGGGSKPATKKAALEVISKRFLELVRDHTQGVQAAKSRPW